MTETVNTYRIPATQIQTLFQGLKTLDYQVIGPTVENKAIVYNYLNSEKDLPRGWTEDHDKGYYRIRRREDSAYFGFTVGPHSWKNFLFPAKEKLWTAKKSDSGFSITENIPEQKKVAFLGVRSCDLHAIQIQDTIFLQGRNTNTFYKIRRESAFIIAVNCTSSNKTCFCASMKTGPSCSGGYDIALTEILDKDSHYFLASPGSKKGEEFLQQILLSISLEFATVPEIENAKQLIKKNAENMHRSLDTKNIKEDLYKNFSHPQWDEVAKRCLNCANCTLVCPTCFCSTVQDVTDLTGSHSERWRLWDSCFSLDHNYIHGGNIRSSVESRYRQWMTHKLGSWIDQFGSSGCVGCGRCIAWCPVGIDITEEMAALREENKNHDSKS
ncbi:MAG: 4Fe-4S dicluster domain-containing protein [Pseudobdellovibrionaceae bacterium]